MQKLMVKRGVDLEWGSEFNGGGDGVVGVGRELRDFGGFGGGIEVGRKEAFGGRKGDGGGDFGGMGMGWERRRRRRR